MRLALVTAEGGTRKPSPAAHRGGGCCAAIAEGPTHGEPHADALHSMLGAAESLKAA
jgi:hypothetical protein